MKKSIFLIIGICAMLTVGSHAQQNRLFGPAAKNRKPWKSPRLSESIVTKKPDKVMGPQAKNRKPWKHEGIWQSVENVDRENIIGPRAKNTFPLGNGYKKHQEHVARSVIEIN